jgi:hypothetical protein
MLVRRPIRERELPNFVCGRMPTSFRNDEGYRLLSFDVVIDGNHGCLADIGVPFQHPLDVTRINVFAARIEHLVGPADKVMKIVLVKTEYIPSNIEPVCRNRCRDIGSIVISEHNGRALYLQHAFVGIPFVASY